MIDEIIKELEKLVVKNCNDLIGNECSDKVMMCHDRNFGVRQAINIVKKHDNDGWHVVADGDLPKTEIDVLVSFGDEYPAIAFYSKKAKVWKNSSTDTRIETDVLAWQPLPQPYKGENNG